MLAVESRSGIESLQNYAEIRRGQTRTGHIERSGDISYYFSSRYTQMTTFFRRNNAIGDDRLQPQRKRNGPLNTRSHCETSIADSFCGCPRDLSSLDRAGYGRSTTAGVFIPSAKE